MLRGVWGRVKTDLALPAPLRPWRPRNGHLGLRRLRGGGLEPFLSILARPRALTGAHCQQVLQPPPHSEWKQTVIPWS